MRQAKVFFVVAAGVLMLAGSFHLGAQSAQGQTGVGLRVGDFGVLNKASAVDFAGNIWLLEFGQSPVGPIQPPRVGHIIVISGVGEGTLEASSIAVLYEDGEYWWRREGTDWMFGGTIPVGAPVQATETTWGRIKAERR